MKSERHFTNAALLARRQAAFAGGIAVLNTGHLHPQVIAAVQAQLELYTHTCFQVVAYEPYVEVCERLNTLAPGDFAKKSLLLTTGAEAVENAIKIARAHTRRPGVIAFTGGYHGRTNLTLGLTGKVAPYKVGFGPFPGEIYHALFPNALHGVSVADALHSVELIFKNDIEPQRVAAFIVEPVQGEGGFNVAPPEFISGLGLGRALRHPADRRRSADRCRPHRHLVCLRAMAGGTRPDHHRQVAGWRLPAVGCGGPRRGDRRPRRGWPGWHLRRQPGGLRRRPGRDPGL